MQMGPPTGFSTLELDLEPSKRLNDAPTLVAYAGKGL